MRTFPSRINEPIFSTRWHPLSDSLNLDRTPLAIPCSDERSLLFLRVLFVGLSKDFLLPKPFFRDTPSRRFDSNAIGFPLPPSITPSTACQEPKIQSTSEPPVSCGLHTDYLPPPTQNGSSFANNGRLPIQSRNTDQSTRESGKEGGSPPPSFSASAITQTRRRGPNRRLLTYPETAPRSTPPRWSR